MCLRNLLFLFFALTINLTLHAAVVEGIVTDAATGETLPGATIVIDGTTIGVIADLNGHFEFPNLPTGRHSLKASFIGYQDNVFAVTVTEGLRYTHNFILVSAAATISEIVISERATGQVRTLNEQKDAANIKNIVSEAQIISFPDLNAADAIQRVPGVTLTRDQGEGKYVQLRGTPPELTNFNVNGIQLPSPESSIRTVGLDVINASQIQTIEITKVLTPDMNGDAIGGSINLKTKRAESTEPEFNVVLAGGYNNLRQSPNGELQFTFSQRKGRIGFL